MRAKIKLNPIIGLSEISSKTVRYNFVIPWGTLGADEGGNSTVELSFPLEDGGGGGDVPEVKWSLSQSSEQLVFQKPIFLCSRSYITRVLRTMIPDTKKYTIDNMKAYEKVTIVCVPRNENGKWELEFAGTEIVFSQTL